MLEICIHSADTEAADAEVQHLNAVGSHIGLGQDDDSNPVLLWIAGPESTTDPAHVTRLNTAIGNDTRTIVVLFGDATAPDCLAAGDVPVLNHDALGTIAFREQLLWHVERALNTERNAGRASRATRTTRWMLIGLGLFFAVLFGSLFHMSYYH